MACAICQTRRPRRFCPGVRGDICTLCCGAEREVSVDCPLDCEYLREAHKHERARPFEPEQLPNRDIDVTEEFLRDNEEFLVFLCRALGRTVRSNPAVIDFDVREALDAAIRTHRTLESGLLYESMPTNPLAAGLYRALNEAIEGFRREEAERLGIHKTRESTALKLLVFLRHFEFSYNNGRPRGRAFLDALSAYYAAEPEAEVSGTSSPLILP